MRFHKNVPQENRDFLIEQLKKYEKEMIMTPEERKELYKWVSSGRSPYDNGNYICNEGGYPLDFVRAMRSEQEQMEWFENLSEVEKNELISSTTKYIPESDEPTIIGLELLKMDPNEELSF